MHQKAACGGFSNPLNAVVIYRSMRYLRCSLINSITYILGEFLQLLVGLPPADECRWLGAGTLALDIICAIRRDESILGKNVHCHRFHYKQRTMQGDYELWTYVSGMCSLLNLRFTSSMTTLLLGGVRFVLLATHTRRAFRCCLPMFG